MTTIDTSTEAVEQLLENVTPGPWQEGQDGNLRVYGPDCCGEHSGLVANVFKGRANTSFIAAARDLIPALLKERDDLRAKLDAATDVLGWYADQFCEGFCEDFPSAEYTDENCELDCGGCKARATLAKIKGADK